MLNDLDLPDKHTILVVDDTPDNLTLMNGLLRDLYKVKVAPSGLKALQILASGPPPDLILLDIMMPEMDGFEVLCRLRESMATREIPVIFLTAMDATQDETRGLELGAVDYITKPISPAIVMARVHNWQIGREMSYWYPESRPKKQFAAVFHQPHLMILIQ